MTFRESHSHIHMLLVEISGLRNAEEQAKVVLHFPPDFDMDPNRQIKQRLQRFPASPGWRPGLGFLFLLSAQYRLVGGRSSVIPGLGQTLSGSFPQEPLYIPAFIQADPSGPK